jgi:hypothetical protein
MNDQVNSLERTGTPDLSSILSTPHAAHECEISLVPLPPSATRAFQNKRSSSSSRQKERSPRLAGESAKRRFMANRCIRGSIGRANHQGDRVQRHSTVSVSVVSRCCVNTWGNGDILCFAYWASVGGRVLLMGKLIQSTLAKAFRGELVPTEHSLAAAEGRAHEPAERLPARVKQKGLVVHGP